MHVMYALVPATVDADARRYTLRQPLVGWRRCAKDMHDQNGLLDTRLTSLRAPTSIAAVGLDGILSENSLTSSQKRQTSKKARTNVEKTKDERQKYQCEEHRKIVFLQAK